MTESSPHLDPSYGEDVRSHRKSSTAVDPKRPCDYCGDTTALLYCRADSAKLCLDCDREVHSANQLFSKHTRTQLCDACDDSPATILCSTENSVFCLNCDWERHNFSLSPVHERRPIEGFTGCPSVTELLAFVGLEDLTKKALVLTDHGGCCGGETTDAGLVGSEFEGLSNLLDWDDHAPSSILSLDDLIVSTNSPHNYNAMEVPPIPKNRKCGQHKEEILVQLRQLAKSEPQPNDIDDDDGFLRDTRGMFHENLMESHRYASFVLENKADFSVPHEVGEFKNHTDDGDLGTHVFISNASLISFPKESPDESLTSVNVGGQSQPPVHSQNVLAVPKIVPCEVSTQERDSAILRYKEKRKTRRYEKHIRYESRKLRAETRTRIKGRFAKIEH